MAGTLYVVATPIGNLQDITYRAVGVLGAVARIACEDTRQTRKLLEHYGIRTPLVSYHDHNESSRCEELLAELRSGRDVALVSDAGTPLVADPGYRLVSRAAAEALPIVAIPGPCAAITALSAAGLPTDAFYFGGFLPGKSSQRRKLLESLGPREETLVFYEAPHRILEALEDIAATLGQRPVALARELTKRHEEWLRGTAASVRAQLAARESVKGEIVLLIGRGAPVGCNDDHPLEDAVRQSQAAGLSRMDAIKAVARRRGLGKREVYRLLEGKPPHG